MKEDLYLYAVAVILMAVWTADSVLDLGLFEPPTPQIHVEREVRFDDVRPIFKDRCMSCHTASSQDWTNYDVAYPNRSKIRSRVWETRSMPFGRTMPEDERQLVRDWVDGGGLK